MQVRFCGNTIWKSLLSSVGSEKDMQLTTQLNVSTIIIV